MKSEYKEVLDTFVRKTNELVHIYSGEKHILVHNAGDAYSRPSVFR